MTARVCLALMIGGSATAQAQSGFTDIGQDIEAETETRVVVHGAFRTRFELLNNLDLDRGLSPSGEPLFPVPLSDPDGQNLTHADMRLRADLAFYAPSVGVAVKVRVDALDNLSLGSQPDGVPSVAVGQRDGGDPIRIKRAYAELLTPLGLLSVGRMANQWGLGMLANGGDCARCDSGDASDRLAWTLPLGGLIWAAAFDLTSIGPYTSRNAPRRAIDLDPWDDVRTITVAAMHWTSDVARRRRARASRATFDYGAYVSHRWQRRDVPAAYLPSANPVPITRAQSVSRGFRATAVDAWARLTLPVGRIELEGAFLTARIDQPSLIPGVQLRDAFTSRQFGLAFQTEFGPAHATEEGWFAAGLDGGFASGDSAPGFGALLGANNRGPNAPPPQPGDLDGPQARAPFDTTVNNFRFHPDYRIDRILFREIIGTVTDAIYLRPHARVVLARLGPGRLEASLAAIFSMAAEPASTPSGERLLGLELDPTVAYVTKDGFSGAIEYAVLFPFAGFDNPAAGLRARPAQLFRLRLGFGF